MSPTTDRTPHGLCKIDTAYSITNNFEEVKKELEKQGELLIKHHTLIQADRINIQNLTDSVHRAIKESTERIIETDSRVEQLEKENKILKYAVGASAVFDFALLFIFMIVTSGY